MKRMVMATVLLVGGCFLHTPTMHAQETHAAAAGNQSLIDQDVSLLRQDIRSKKKQLIAANLSLTDTEATKFWPVYDQYTAELTKLGDRKYALSLVLDEQIAQLRAKYVPIVSKVLPGTKTATFFQLDRRLTSLLDVQLASQIPLVQDQSSGGQ